MNIQGMVIQCVRKGKRRWTYRIIVFGTKSRQSQILDPPESWATYEMAAERLDEILRAMKS